MNTSTIAAPPPEWEVEVSAFTPADVAELVVLQRCCWVAEAIDNNTLDLPALREGPDDVLSWGLTWRVILLRRQGRLIAAVRAQQVGHSWEIGRLMVAPDQGGKGIGRWLLAEAEALAPAEIEDFILFTGAGSVRNLRMYQRAGYVLGTAAAAGSGAHHIPGAVYLRKPRPERCQR